MFKFDIYSFRNLTDLPFYAFFTIKTDTGMHITGNIFALSFYLIYEPGATF